MKTTGIYIRVSTTSQTFDSQEPDLNRWIELHKVKNFKWYRDKFSGQTMQRPAFDQLMEDVKVGKVEQVVIWRMDRLGRTASGLTWLFNYMLDNNINLISLKDGFDLKQPQGRLLANLLASIAQFENELRGERVRAGQQAARAKGKRWGGSKKGQRKAKTIEKLNAVLNLRKQGTSKAEISRVVGLSVPTVANIIQKSN